MENRKKLTIKEFSEMLGVSTATVSRAFSSRGRISEKTREMIIKRAAEVGYHANIHASSLSRRRSNTVALFYPSIGHSVPDYFMTEILLGINETLAEYRKMLQIHPFSERSDINIYREYILSGGLAGVIIVAGAKGSRELVNIARAADVPYIVIGHMSGESTRAVVFDNEYGAYQAGIYFSEKGRCCPVYVGGHLDRRKKAGFRRGLGEHADRLFFTDGGNCFADGERAFDYIMRNYPTADCVLCANDVLAIGLIRAAASSGVKVPEDIAVIGFDNINISKYYLPALTTVSLNLYQIGESAVKQLEKLLKEGELSRNKTVNCELIIRETA